MKKSLFIKNCKYDYKNTCDCSEDDTCGCNYPNNINHNFTKACFEDDILSDCNIEIENSWKNYDILSNSNQKSLKNPKRDYPK